MKNISNAYLVLSVAEIRVMLHAGELEQKVRGETRESICISLHNLVVRREPEHPPQISSDSIMRAVDRLVDESNNALEDTAAKLRE